MDGVMADTGEGGGRPAPLLKAVAITKKFGDFAANAAIDLDLYPAEIHALLGENGAGKTTTVRILTTLLQADEGTASVEGYDVHAQADDVRSP